MAREPGSRAFLMRWRRLAPPLAAARRRVVTGPARISGRVHEATTATCMPVFAERVAINIDDFRIPDNEGQQVVDRPIHPDGENAYFSTLPIKAIVKALTENGFTSQISNSAGTYLCNHIMYESLYHVNKNGLRSISGFIHVPLLNILEEERQIRMAKLILDAVIDYLGGE